MSKLFQLKEWLTIAEASRHLSDVFRQEVFAADILRLALDRRLTLSANFVNPVYVRRGKIMLVEDAKLAVMEKAKLEGFSDLPPSVADLVVAGLRRFDEKRVFQLENEVTSLYGVYDLPMVGAEVIDVEQRCQKLSDGPEVTLEDYEGAFVQGEGFTIYQLQDYPDDNVIKSSGDLEEPKWIDIEPGEAMRLQQKRAEAHDRELTRSCYPADRLPHDAVLVVRTNALRDLQERLEPADKKGGRELGSRAETTYLNIIGALLHLILGKSPGGISHSVFKDQAAVIENLLATHPRTPGLSKRTLEEKFPAAKKSLDS